MNRQIKFRAWEKPNVDEKEMTSADNPDFQGKMHYIRLQEDFISFVAQRPQEYILMQFTGLKDKNGKEIYESDIVEFSKIDHEGRFTGTAKKIVRFKDGAWITDNGGNRTGTKISRYLNSHKIWETNLEVIGNIYESPELLK